MSVPLYFDVHVPYSITFGLRLRGVDVLTSQEDGTREVDDDVLLDLDRMPDRYLAVEPRLDSAALVWRVKVVLTYPFIGSIGEVGEIAISVFSEEVLSHTPLDEMRERGHQLYEQHSEAIQTAFSQAGNWRFVRPHLLKDGRRFQSTDLDNDDPRSNGQNAVTWRHSRAGSICRRLCVLFMSVET